MKRAKILTLTEKKQLDSMYCSNTWEVLSKILRNQKETIKTAVFKDVSSMEDFSFFKGEMYQILWLENQLFLNHKEIRKEKDAKEKSTKSKDA